MVRDSLLYLLASLAARAAGFLMIPFYSSYLSPAQYGTIELIELATQVVSLVVGLSMFGGALIRIFQGTEDPARQNQIASTAVLAAMALNAAGVAVAVASAGALSALLFPSADAAGLLRLTLLAMFFGNAVDLCLCYVRLKDRAVMAVSYSLVALVLTLGLNIYFIAFRGQGVQGFVLSKLLVTGTGAILLVFFTLRETGLRFEWGSAGEMVRFGAPLILANAAFFSLHFSDRFFLSRLATLTDVGNYSLAYKFGFLVTFLVAEPFGRAWNVRYVAMTRTPGWQHTFRSVSRLLCASMAATGLAIALFSDELLRFLVSPPYFPSFRIIPIIVAAYFIREMGDFFKNMLFVKLRSSLVGAVSVVAALVNFALNWLWIPRFGMLGAAWATLLTWLLYALTLYILTERCLEVGFPWYSYLAIAGSAAFCFLVGLPFAGLPVAAQFVVDAILLATFLAVAWKSSILSHVERELVLEKARLGRAFLVQHLAVLRRA